MALDLVIFNTLMSVQLSLGKNNANTLALNDKNAVILRSSNCHISGTVGPILIFFFLFFSVRQALFRNRGIEIIYIKHNYGVTPLL